MAITVRYHLDAGRLVYIHNTLPSAVDSEVVQPVIGSTFRGIAPNYTVREVFAVKREEIRKRASDEIARTLGADGIVVKEVMLREVQLPPEYAKGLEGLLLKEQENDQMSVQAEIKQKEVRVAEYEAEADKVREEKRAEAGARVRVLQAKAEADAMQYTLPAEREADPADAAGVGGAQGSHRQERRGVGAGQGHRQQGRARAAQPAGRCRGQPHSCDRQGRPGTHAGRGRHAQQSPLLINKIIAERLSDKLQIMMVPADGKYFFASDVLRGQMPQIMRQQDEADDPPRPVQSR